MNTLSSLVLCPLALAASGCANVSAKHVGIEDAPLVLTMALIVSALLGAVVATVALLVRWARAAQRDPESEAQLWMRVAATVAMVGPLLVLAGVIAGPALTPAAGQVTARVVSAGLAAAALAAGAAVLWRGLGVRRASLVAVALGALLFAAGAALNW